MRSNLVIYAVNHFNIIELIDTQLISVNKRSWRLLQNIQEKDVFQYFTV